MSTASSHDWISWDVALIGEGFQVPQDTVVRYVTKDWAGETESHGMLSSNALGAITINVSLNTAYIDLAIGVLLLSRPTRIHRTHQKHF